RCRAHGGARCPDRRGRVDRMFRPEASVVMSSSRDHLTAQLDGLKRQSLTMRGESLSRRGEADPQRLVEDLKRAIGRAIEDAIKAAKLEKKDVAARMGYTDQ